MIPRGVAKVEILGGCRDLVLPTDLITVTDIGEGLRGGVSPSSLDLFMIFK